MLCIVFQALDYTSTLRPFSISLAPRSLSSTGVRQSSDSTWLPRPSSLALVRCHPHYTTVFHFSGCASSLHPSGYIGLLLPSSVALVLTSSGSARPAEHPSPPQSHEPAVPPRPSPRVSSIPPGTPPSPSGITWYHHVILHHGSSLLLLHHGVFCLP